jgi:hypothetical protein
MIIELDEITKYPLYQDEIVRSALLDLKGTGTAEKKQERAAATTSLPETIGEVRNWDTGFKGYEMHPW